MTSAGSRLKWAAEGMAVMLGLAGAAVVTYVDLPEPERVAAPETDSSTMQLIEIELVEPEGDAGDMCRRGYSSARSTSRIDSKLVEEFVAFVCAESSDCAPIAPETAICIAEERFFGEGRARGITYIANPFAWVVSGEHQRVFVDAQSGDAVAINFPGADAEDEMARDVARAIGR